ncbi:hypothetical protein [Blastococcus sp. SYSU DS1024]
MTQPPTGDEPAGPPDPAERPGAGPADGSGATAWSQPAGPSPAAPVPGESGGWRPPYGQQPPAPGQQPHPGEQAWHGGQPPSAPPPYGPPPYGGPGGPSAARPRKRTLLPWLIGAAVLLIAGLAFLWVVLLNGGDGERRSAERSVGGASGFATPLGGPSSAPLGGTGQLPGGARGAEPVPAQEGRYAGSGDVALAWVEAMGQGDFQAAFDLSCVAVQEAAVDAAAGDDPAQVLGDYFYRDTLGGQGFTSGTFDGVEHQVESATDMASFTLELDDGEPFLLLVHVGDDGTVCDFF